MANFYVSTTGSGSGVGSEADPFTLTQAAATAYVADDIWIKAGTYSLTASLSWADIRIRIHGYNTTIGDLDEVWGEGTGATAKPLIQSSSNVGNMWTVGNYTSVYNIICDGVDGTKTTGHGFVGQTALSIFINCYAKNIVTTAKYGFSSLSKEILCIASSCENGFGGITDKCLAKNITTLAFAAESKDSVAYNATTGFSGGVLQVIYSNCTATHISGNAFVSGRPMTCINCIAEDITGTVFYSASTNYGGCITINCNAWNYGTLSTNSYNMNLTTLDPALTNPAGDDFSLGNANLYGLGAYIGSLDGTGTLDLGVIQKNSGVTPGAINVRNGIATGITVGSCVVPIATEVRFGTNVDDTTGTCYVPTAANVRSGINVDATTGNMILPSESDVQKDVSYGTTGTEYTGTLYAYEQHNYTVRVTFTEVTSGANEYIFPHVQNITNPLEGIKTTLIEGGRADGSIVIPGGKKSQIIEVEGIIYENNYDFIDIITDISTMRSSITTNLAYLTMEYWDGDEWQTVWQYTVRRTDEITFEKNFMTDAQPYTASFIILEF